MKRYLKVLVFAIVSFVPIYPYFIDITAYKHLGAFGDLPQIINPFEELALRTSVYNHIAFGGMHEPFNLANLSPFFILQIIGTSLHLSTLQTWLLGIYLSYFAGLLSIFAFLNSYFNKSQYTNIVVSIIYIFSPYYLGFFHPGHFPILLLFFLAPYCIYLIKKVFEANMSSDILKLFFTSLLMSASLANVSYLLIFMFVLNIYIFFLYSKSTIKRSLHIQTVLNAVILGANLWWILPTLIYFLKNAAEQFSYSKTHLGAAINIAAKDLSMTNILFNNFESSNFLPDNRHLTIISGLIEYSYMVLFTLGLVPFVFKKASKLHYSVLFILLIIIFLLKSINPPFADLFKYMYEHIPLMQIIRRPQSKIYWLYLFSLTILVSYFLRYYPKKIYGYLLTIIAIFYLSIYIYSGKQLRPFNVPTDYQQAKKYIEESPNSQVLILPSINLQLIQYDKSLNGIGGVDFLKNYIRRPQYSDDLYLDLILNKNTKNKVLRTMNAIYSERDDKKLCNQLSELGITHILVRKNMNSTIKYKSQYLNNHLFISQIDGRHLQLFKVTEQCNLYNSNLNDKTKINLPYLKVVQTNGAVIKNRVHLYQNFDNNWKLYLYFSNKSPYENIKNNLFFNNTILLHSRYFGFANEWMVRVPTNENSTIYFIFLYFPQLYFYIGIILTIIMIAILLRVKKQ